MNARITLICCALFFLFSCSQKQKPTEQANTADMKALLINGSWEANYIAGTATPFAEQYANLKPAITVDAEKGTIQGNTGCNSFQGNVKVDGNKISIPADLATTRKMCPDMAGEQAFLAALKKVNSYSVTEQGKTLNLIAGDIAVMRLVRK